MTKAAELRELDDERPRDTASSRPSKELFNLRFQLATGQLDNVARIATVRREIARLLTARRAERDIVARRSDRRRRT